MEKKSRGKCWKLLGESGGMGRKKYGGIPLEFGGNWRGKIGKIAGVSVSMMPKLYQNYTQNYPENYVKIVTKLCRNYPKIIKKIVPKLS